MTPRPRLVVSFTTVWEFEVAASKRTEFVRCYGPEGDWVGLFRYRADYDALDRKCEGLTVREAHLGAFLE